MAFKPFDVKSASEADFIAHMTLESIKLLDGYNYEMKYKFLLAIVNHMVFTALKTVPEKPCGKQELIDFTQKNFALTKHNIQTMVAGAFAQAMGLYAGRKMDYTCTITPLKEEGPKLLLN